MSTAKDTQPLFPVYILHAMNALQFLRACYILSESSPKARAIYSSAKDIAAAIGAPEDSMPRTLRMLRDAGIIEAKMGPEGGYHIDAQALFKFKVVDVLRALGREIPENGTVRASDKLYVTVLDCLSLTLDEFFR